MMSETPPQDTPPYSDDTLDEARKQQLLAEAGNTISGQSLGVDPRHQELLEEERRRHEEILNSLGKNVPQPPAKQ